MGSYHRFKCHWFKCHMIKCHMFGCQRFEYYMFVCLRFFLTRPCDECHFFKNSYQRSEYILSTSPI